MFTNSPNLDELRQGDIIRGLYYPQLTCQSLPLLGSCQAGADHHVPSISLIPSINKKNGIDWLTTQVQVLRGYSMVLSPCCDLELRNGRLEVPAITVSPLLAVPHLIRTNPHSFELLQKNPIDDYGGMYCINPRHPLQDAYVIDFCRATSIPKSEWAYLLQGKILQLDDRERVKFKTKLGMHFSRPTSEEEAAGFWDEP